MALADREWRLVREESWDGPVNMALDEIAAATAAEGGPRTVRVYQWDPSTLSLGYRQDPETVDWTFCEREGITVTRRPTGGGGIYHDRYGDISYTIVAPADELPGDLMETYELLCEPLFDAFDRLGIDARFTAEELPAIHQPACYLRELHPAHDVVAGDDGRKISGNAQYRRKDAIIQHGSIKFDLNAERHLGVFADPDTSPEAFRERVTTVAEQSRATRDRTGERRSREQGHATREDAVSALEGALADWADADEGSWTDAELADARDHAARKFGSDSWTRERTDPTA